MRDKISIYEKIRSSKTTNLRESHRNLFKNTVTRRKLGMKDDVLNASVLDTNHLSVVKRRIFQKTPEIREIFMQYPKISLFHLVEFSSIPSLWEKLSAFADTGSNISAIRYDALYFLGDVDLRPENKTLVGIGGKRITTIGNFTVCVRLDDVELDVTFHIVKVGDILYSIQLLGYDIFEKVDMLVNLLGVNSNIFRWKFVLRWIMKRLAKWLNYRKSLVIFYITLLNSLLKIA